MQDYLKFFNHLVGVILHCQCHSVDFCFTEAKYDVSFNILRNIKMFLKFRHLPRIVHDGVEEDQIDVP